MSRTTKEALAALQIQESSVLEPLALAWVQHLELRYDMAVRQTLQHDDQPTLQRLHLQAAACYADLLATHYGLLEQTVTARNWHDRAVRYHRRAFRPTKKILKNIGGVMP